jgi:hypothetical protein
MLVLLLAVADLGRMYTSAVAVEAGAREAADYGAFRSANWRPENRSLTVAEMQKRGCTAASTLPGYQEPPGTVGHAVCTNPSFGYALERVPASGDCVRSIPACLVRVTLRYDFRTTLPVPIVLEIRRESVYAVSDLDSPSGPMPTWSTGASASLSPSSTPGTPGGQGTSVTATPTSSATNEATPGTTEAPAPSLGANESNGPTPIETPFVEPSSSPEPSQAPDSPSPGGSPPPGSAAP